TRRRFAHGFCPPYPPGLTVSSFCCAKINNILDQGWNLVEVVPPTGTDDPDLDNNQASYRIYRLLLPIIQR
ncbi:MAG TPA: hypothetical protein PKG95_04055, partial [Anaerolineaceae bacterium]|nr:hypothetical protein [Anaerolineaceae bacterium]